MLARVILVSLLVVTVWATALEARSAGQPQRPPSDCVRVQLPPGIRVPLGARLQVIGRCELELRRLIGEKGLLDRARRSCPGLLSRRCATEPVSAS